MFAQNARREAAEEFLKRKEQIKWDDLETMVILGEGSFGRVKLCHHKPTSSVRHNERHAASVGPA